MVLFDSARNVWLTNPKASFKDVSYVPRGTYDTYLNDVFVKFTKCAQVLTTCADFDE